MVFNLNLALVLSGGMFDGEVITISDVVFKGNYLVSSLVRQN